MVEDSIGTLIGVEMQAFPPFVELVDWITLWTLDLYAILDDDNEALVSCTGAFEIDDDSFFRTIDTWFDDDDGGDDVEASQRITSFGSV